MGMLYYTLYLYLVHYIFLIFFIINVMTYNDIILFIYTFIYMAYGILLQ